MKSLVRSALALLVIFSVIFLVACPKKDAIKEAANASFRLPAATRTAIRKTGEAYDKKFISFETKNKWADRFIALGKVEQKLVVAVDAINKIYQQTKVLPADKVSDLKKLFNDDILKIVFAVLEDFKLLSPDQSEFLRLAINGIRLLIITIGNGFGFDVSAVPVI